MEQWLTIGQLAQITGVPAKTIRYYEQVGVLSAPRRSEAGYRQYAQRNTHRLLFIRRARALGLSLHHITTLTATLDSGSCGTMRPQLLDLVRTQLHTVQQQIAEFQLLQQQLEQLSDRLMTAPPSDHAEGCQCLELGAVPAEKPSPQEPRTSAPGEQPMRTQRSLEPLTVLATTHCDDGSCGCGCGLSLGQLSPPQADEQPPAVGERAEDWVRGDAPREEAR